ncbi:hypothetical protein J8273_2985 [Carpediemonas membranifera]|uniref:Uncharacterized protein n=1 Tax=Carpediemonas membranifera TaxID=201153 RepID=A0A8J6B4B0_9EUKA|nr:hypothetical protein J8273_2985 [Carpediemonas membranifera]|eukprot:KAG9395418.1 hypothetical protein J8273_2985 [Carpediemonas membranifera]
MRDGKKARDALIAAHRLSIMAASNIVGDVPSLIALAFRHNFDEEMPHRSRLLTAFNTFIHKHMSQYVRQDANSFESLLTTLSEIPPLEPTAQALLDRARSILTSGPPLSMNVELAEGQELPAALHTLNQGAVWACLMGGGANPDLEDRLLTEALWKQPRDTEIHDKIRNALTPEGKCLWFLCRKFFFTMNVAEKDGESYQYAGLSSCYHHHMYMGRLFMLHTANHTALTRARMPRALEVYGDEFAHIARTPKGLWGWGDSDYAHLGIRSSRNHFVDPTCLTFPACPKVAELEASLPPWEKHRMVTDVSLVGHQTFILTQAGTITSGCYTDWFSRCRIENVRLFNPVAVPAGFVPDHIMRYRNTLVILSMGDRQIVSGWNRFGRLGLGHKNGMTGFVDLPFRVDRIITSLDEFNVFLSDRQLLFAGQVPEAIDESGLLSSYKAHDKCLTPTPFRFPERVKGFWCDYVTLLWVTEGRTHMSDCDKQYSVPFEAVECETIWIDGHAVHSFRDSAGQWLEARVSDGVAELFERGSPRSWDDIISVDVDPFDS